MDEPSSRLGSEMVHKVLFADLCDDAAIFPPGYLPLAQAVPAHISHAAGRYAAVVGPFVSAAKELPRLAALVADMEQSSFRLSLVASLPAVEAALSAVDAMPAVHLSALEVDVPEAVSPEAAVAALGDAVSGRLLPVFVELPRDSRRASLLEALAGTPYQAKLRTGGVRADLYPNEAELGAAVVALISHGVPFKATAGLHRAVRNTDPRTGFEQHGFLNVMIAVQAAIHGADENEVARLLEERDSGVVVAMVRRVEVSVRRWFTSFGTCSITEPVEDLVALGLLPRGYLIGGAS